MFISHARRFLGFLFCSVLTGGCGTAEPTSVEVAWWLADGRSCLDTSIIAWVVEVRDGVGSEPVTGRCRSQPAQNRATVGGVLPDSTLEVRGLTLPGAVVYRGKLRMPDPVPAQVTMSLIPMGGS
jgi:hypothetical protein